MMQNQTSTRCNHDPDAGVKWTLIHGFAGMPVADLNSLVRDVVVHHQVEFPSQVSTSHILEETQELLMAVPVLKEPGHLPGDDLQSSEQDAGAMANVAVATSLVMTRFHRTHLLDAIQLLGLGLLIDTQHDHVNRRIQIQTYNIGNLDLQFRDDGELKRVSLPRPDPCASSRPW